MGYFVPVIAVTRFCMGLAVKAVSLFNHLSVGLTAYGLWLLLQSLAQFFASAGYARAVIKYQRANGNFVRRSQVSSVSVPIHLE
jgi:hypothetical protein